MSKQDDKSENRQYLDIILNNDNIARKTLLPSLFVMMLIFLYFGVPYPLIPLSVLMAIYFFGSGAVILVIKRGWVRARDLYFVLLCLLGLIAAVTMYYTGGPESFMFPIFPIITILAALALPFRRVVLVVLCAGLCYYTEIWLEVNRLVPHIPIFKELMPAAGYAASAYFLVIPAANFIILAAVTALAYLLARLLKERWARLSLLNRELAVNEELLVKRDEEKTRLSRQMDDKINELDGLRMNLEQIVEKQTGDLKTKISELGLAGDKLTAKVAELSAFRGLVAGREKKMLLIKREIDQLRQELGRPPKYQG